MRIAITRDVGPDLGLCQLTHLRRVAIDVALARAQHRRYEDLLGELGCEVHRIHDEPGMPDAVFVEDTAVVLDEVAIVARPGAPSRRHETAAVAKAIEPYRPLRSISAPGTLDGGDVLRVGRTLFVGASSRTNDDAMGQVAALVEPLGYRVVRVSVSGCLHLKSAVTKVGPGVVLINPAWVDARMFRDLELIEIDAGEPYAANALRVGRTVVCPEAYPATRALLAKRGLDVRALDASELAKAEGALTCCSVIFEA